jgi:SAM-dependent methyltransferase
MSARGPGFDYDRGDLHRTYAAGRALTPEQVALWSSLLAGAPGEGPVRRVLDLGCGIGRFSGLLRDVLAAPVVGVDRSERMLAVAAADPALRGIPWVHATAEALPLREASVDLALMFLVYHHLPDRPAALRECARVLARGGRLVLVNSTVELLDSYVWLPFFPSARAIDLARLPDRGEIARVARDAGLILRGHRTVLNPVARSLGAYADRIASRTISTLQLVPDDEFARGAVEFRRHCAREDRGQPVVDAIDVFVLAPAGGTAGPAPARGA